MAWLVLGSSFAWYEFVGMVSIIIGLLLTVCAPSPQTDLERDDSEPLFSHASLQDESLHIPEITERKQTAATVDVA
jgi:hypothetical protein